MSEVVKTLVVRTFYCDGSRGNSCMHVELPSGTVCEVHSKDGDSLYVYPIVEELSHLWAGFWVDQVEHLNGMETLAEMAR